MGKSWGNQEINHKCVPTPYSIEIAEVMAKSQKYCFWEMRKGVTGIMSC